MVRVAIKTALDEEPNRRRVDVGRKQRQRSLLGTCGRGSIGSSSSGGAAAQAGSMILVES